MQHRSFFAQAHLRALTRSAYRIPHPSYPIRTIVSRASKLLPPGSSSTVLINRATRNPTAIIIPPAQRNWQPSNKPANPPAAAASSDPRSTPIERRPTNSQIQFKMVRVVDPTTNKLSPTAQSLKELLDATDLRRYCVELVSSNPENPIVRIVTKAEVEEKYKKMKRVLRKGQRVNQAPKEVRLVWGVAKADLDRKLQKGRGHLEKGHRLIVSVALRPRQPRPTRQETQALIGEVTAVMDGLGVEWKPMEFAGKQILLYFKPLNAADDPPEESASDQSS